MSENSVLSEGGLAPDGGPLPEGDDGPRAGDRPGRWTAHPGESGGNIVSSDVRTPGQAASSVIADVASLCSNLYRLGWDERNGGNISVLLDAEQVAPDLGAGLEPRVLPLGFDAADLAGRHLLVTGSGKYFRHVAEHPDTHLGLVRVTADGAGVQVLWGLADGGLPTSELPAHLLCHSRRLAADPAHRVVIHTHATHLIAMTFTHELDEVAFTRTLWEMCTECLVVFPDGVGVVPWLVPGTVEIGTATAEAMRRVRLVLWPHHGVYGAGTSLDEAFGLIETAEKAAQVYTWVQAQGGKRQTITTDQLLALAARFGVTPRDGVLG